MQIKKTNYSKFILVSHARSGSNLLLSTLNSHPNIIANSEIFAGHNRNKGEDFYPILNSLFCDRPQNIQAVGCKIFYYHLNKNEWYELSKIPDLKVIHLIRQNKLSMIASMKVAFKTDQWGIKNDSERIDISKKQIKIDDEALRNSFMQIDSWQAKTNEIFSKHQLKEVFYEDFTSQFKNTIYRLYDFLDLPNLPDSDIEIKHKKQNPEPLNQLIKNYSELKQSFKNTPWQHYFI